MADVASELPADITGEPPPDVAAELASVRASLDDIPAKQLGRNLLIATWNVRAFGGLTKKWHSGPDDSPKRDLRDMLCIAEIVSRFDVVALQEVRGDLRAFRYMMKALGQDWAFLLTDVTKGKEGNNERMAFVYDTRRVKPSGLAAELVVSLEEEAGADPRNLDKQFARTPYAVSFLSAGCTFILVTMHVIYGKAPSERKGELYGIAKWLANWGETLNEFRQNLVLLGDFNIDRKEDPLYEAFTSTGLRPPPQLESLPRTIFESPDRPDKAHYYDQIVWFEGDDGSKLVPPLAYTNRGGSFDFTRVITAPDKDELSWRISDHYPLWVELSVRPG